MLSIGAPTLHAFLQSNWGWAAGLAASMLALTLLAGGLLNQARKDEIALWLMGAQSEENWSRSFTSLFDAVFGTRHLSLRCFLRSAAASLIAVAVIWLLMGNLGALGLRMRSDLSLGGVLVIALAVNVVADYLSLLETRLLLGRMPRAWPAQAAVLALDLALSAAIIWLAILAYINSPLHEGEIESFAEILGLFSIFSVLFYSTFLTSVWTWAYILSAWLMRAVTRLRLAHWLDVEQQPIRILGLLLAAVVFLGAMTLALPFRRDPDGLTAADRALCTLFQGRVCLDVAELTSAEQAKLHLITLACAGGVTEECLRRGRAAIEVKPEEAARLWTVACEGGNARGCNNLGVLNQNGIGMDPDPAEAARLYRQGCDGGDPLSCSNLGYLHEYGIGTDPNPAAAARLYRQGCDGGEAQSCLNLVFLQAHVIGIGPDPASAARLYRQGCDGGDARGCSNLGVLHEEEIGKDPDPADALQ